MNKLIKDRAKKLRKNSTDTEKYLWYLLRNRNLNGFKFRRQYVIGNYIVDFVCIEKKLIIELDGGQHSESQLYDEKRTQYLTDKGYRVLRFWNHDVFKQTWNVLNSILKTIES